MTHFRITPCSICALSFALLCLSVLIGRGRREAFKKKNYLSSYAKLRNGSGGGKVVVWRNLKQIIQAQNYDEQEVGAPTYTSIDSAYSTLPAKHYSDISGFVAKYTDPVSKLRFSNASEYKLIKTLPEYAVQALLAMRQKGGKAGRR